MIRQTHQGFTIIELMLVVAISGALMAAVLVGSGTAISQQRYRDSVNSLKTFIQGQYDKVANTVNDRTGDQSCTPSATISTTSAQTIGTGDCVLIGRYVTVAANGVDLAASSVVAYRAPGTQPVPGTSELNDLKTYTLGTAAINPDATTVAWGSKIVKKKTTAPIGYSLLIVRSPLSGSLMTFSAEGAVTPTNLVTPVNKSTTRYLCVNPSGVAFSKRLAVEIPANAANQGDIQIPIETSSVCD